MGLLVVFHMINVNDPSRTSAVRRHPTNTSCIIDLLHGYTEHLSHLLHREIALLVVKEKFSIKG